MKTTYEDANVQCPYYNEEAVRKINCEGVEGRSVLQQVFHARGDKIAYKNRYCCDGWKSCLIAKMLNKKYDYTP